MTPTCPPDLRAHYRAGRLIPFVGAGISAGMRWQDASGDVVSPPSWNALVEKASSLLGFDRPELIRARGTDLQILEYFNVKNGGIDQLVNWLIGRLNAPDDVLRGFAVHQALAAMSACPLIYTTNYDRLIERAFDLHGRKHVTLSREHDFPAAFAAATADETTCQIVKFHGDIDARETMVVTEAHYQRRLKLSDAMDLRLRSDLLGRAVLFIGYSFSDPNVSYIFSLINEEFKELPDSQHGQRAFIAIPDPSDFERRLFKQRRIDVIALDSARRTEETAELLRLVGDD